LLPLPPLKGLPLPAAANLSAGSAIRTFRPPHLPSLRFPVRKRQVTDNAFGFHCLKFSSFGSSCLFIPPPFHMTLVEPVFPSCVSFFPFSPPSGVSLFRPSPTPPWHPSSQKQFKQCGKHSEIVFQSAIFALCADISTPPNQVSPPHFFLPFALFLLSGELLIVESDKVNFAGRT